MTEAFIIDWPGASGKSYRYWSNDLTSSYKDEAGNYMFVKPSGNGYLPVYIVQADSLKIRLANHERLSEAKRAGATLAMSHTSPSGEQARLAEERDLIAKWSPPLNVQHKKVL